MRGAVRRASLILCGLILFMTLVIGAVVVIPRRLLGAPNVTWLGYSLCRLPCWRGFTPGQTDNLQALRRMRGMTDTTDKTEFTTMFSQSDLPNHLLMMAFDQVKGIRLADLIQVAGTPTTINIIHDPQHGALLTLHYTPLDMTALANLSQSMLDRMCTAGFADAPIDYLQFSWASTAVWPGVRWQGLDAITQELCP